MTSENFLFIPFRRLNLDAKMKTNRPVEVPVHYHDKLNILLDDLQKNGKLKTIWLNASYKAIFGISFLEPLSFFKKYMILFKLC